MAFSAPMALPGPLKAGLFSGTIMTGADVFAQLAIEGKRAPSSLSSVGSNHGDNSSSSSTSSALVDYDPQRTVRWSVAGLCIHGPYFFVTFRWIDRVFANHTLNLRTVLLKTATAQFTAFPGYLALLYGFLGVAEGIRTYDAMSAKICTKVPEAFLGGCVFWPIANTVNFSVVASAWRAPYLAGVGSIWNTFLSWLNAREKSLKD